MPFSLSKKIGYLLLFFGLYLINLYTKVLKKKQTNRKLLL